MEYRVRESFDMLAFGGVLGGFSVYCVFSRLGVLMFFKETCNCCVGKVRRCCYKTTCVGGRNIFA